MKMSFRWFGPEDRVNIEHIRQIPGMVGIVSALHHIENGKVWERVEIAKRKAEIEKHNLKWTVIESIPVHEDIKRGLPTRDAYIEAWAKSVENAGAEGIDTICYNFMPVLDWTRTDLRYELPDKSKTLIYVHKDLEKFNGSLPGWEEAYTPEELQKAIDAYKNIDTEKYWEHLEYFLKRVVPVAEKAGVKLAIHPDDPPFSLFGLPRIITGADSIRRLFKLVDSKANGITFCTGSYGILPENNLPEMVKIAGERLHFAHLRNIIRTRVSDGTVDFEESTHYGGELDLAAVMKALVDIGFEGAIRPDHGRAIFSESNGDGKPGYWLHDRALGTQYLLGLERAFKQQKHAA